MISIKLCRKTRSLFTLSVRKPRVEIQPLQLLVLNLISDHLFTSVQTQTGLESCHSPDLHADRAFPSWVSPFSAATTPPATTVTIMSDTFPEIKSKHSLVAKYVTEPIWAKLSRAKTQTSGKKVL